MRVTWNGSLSFGLVSIPVGLAPATKPAARQSDVSFRLLHRECLTPIKQKRWCPKHDREVGAGRARQGLGGREGAVRRRRGGGARGARAPRRLAHDRRSSASSRWRTSTRSGWTARTSSSRAPRRRSAGRTSCSSRRWRRPASARSAASCAPGASRSASSARRGRGARARDDVPRRGRLLAGRDRRGDGGDRGEEAPSSTSRARSSRGSRPSSTRRSSTSDYRRDLRDAARGEAARRGAHRAGARAEPAPAVDLIEALKASVAAAKASSAPAREVRVEASRRRSARARKAARK